MTSPTLTLDLARTLDRLALEAALRHPDPTTPPRDPRCAALAGSRARADVARLHRAQSAWLHVRDRWLDHALRRHIVPGHAAACIVGAGLDPRLGRLPSGLLGEGRVALIDRAEVLEARAARLRAAGLDEIPQAHVQATQSDTPEAWLDAVCAALDAQPSQQTPTLLWVGLANRWGLPAFEATLEALAARLTRPARIAFDWLGPELRALPDGLGELLEGGFGAPWPTQPLALSMWLKALGAQAPETTPLLSWRAQQVGFASDALMMPASRPEDAPLSWMTGAHLSFVT